MSISEVDPAYIGLLGVLLGGCFAWVSAYLLKRQDAKIQKEHAKFTSYHTKQVEILAELYRQLSTIETKINEVVLSLPKKAVPKERWAKYLDDTNDPFNELINLKKLHSSYLKEQSVYLSDEIENKLEETIEDVDTLLFIRQMDPHTWNTSKEAFDIKTSYESSIEFVVSEINSAMRNIKSEVKNIVQGKS